MLPWSVCLSVCLCVCLLVMFVSPAKTAEPNEMPFRRGLAGGGLSRMTPGNHVLDGFKIPQGELAFCGLSAPLKSIETLLRCAQ